MTRFRIVETGALTLAGALTTILTWWLTVLIAWVLAGAPPAAAQTEYFYGDVECGLGPGRCELRDFSVPGAGGLDASTVAKIQRSVDGDSWERDPGDNELSVAKNDGTDAPLDLPGLSVESRGSQQGTAYEVWTIDCRAALSCTVTGSKATFTVPDLSGSIAAAAARLAELDELDQALRARTAIITGASVTATDRNTGYSVSGGKWPTPDGTADHEIGYSITPQGESAITGSFSLSALRSLTPIVRDGLGVTASNAIRIVVGDDSYFLGRDTNEDIFFGSSEAGIQYALSLTDDRVDTTPFLRGLIPTARLCTGTRDSTTIVYGDGVCRVAPTGGGGGGLTTSQVLGLIVDWAEQGSTATIPAGRLPNASASGAGIMAVNDFNKLQGIDAGADVNRTPVQQARSLETLTGADRLAASAIKDLPPDTDTDTFLGQTDTPDAYTGEAGRMLLVNSSTNALIFVNGPATWSQTGDQTTIPYAKLPPFDSIVRLTGQTGSAQGPDRRIGANNNTSTLATFSVGGVDFTLRRLYWAEDDDDFSVYMTADVLGPNQSDADAAIALLASYHIRINTAQLVFGDATLADGDDPVGVQNTTTLEWNFDAHLTSAPIGLDSENAVTIFEPLDAGNFAPGNCAREQIQDWSGTVWECEDLPHVPGARQAFDGLVSLLAPEAQDTRYDTAVYFTDIDLRTEQHGELHIACDITLSASTTGSAANLSFTQNDAETPRNREESRSEIVFLSQIRNAAHYESQTNPQGLELVELPVYSAATHAGTFWLRAVRQETSTTAAYHPGLFQWYEGLAGTEGPLTIGANCAATYTPSDAVGASSSTVSPTITEAVLATDASLTTSSSAGTWTAWTDLVTLAAVTSTQAGPILLDAEAMGSVVTASTGGGDRVYIEARLVRTRSSVTTHLELAEVYVRNMSGLDGVFAAATRNFSMAMAFMDTARAGDVYKIQWRAISQVAARQIQMQSTLTRLQMMSF